ncbi:hypothetical protein EJ02DRAFT_495756, partial [Clathrospora elynae]
AVVTKYVDILKPLKVATEWLEGRGKKQHKLNGRFGAIYEVIPTFEQLINTFEERLLPYTSIDFERYDAPEDHIAINLRAALAKLKLFYAKLSNSPAYYAAVVLHPRYWNYCKLLWDPAQLAAADATFQQLWRLYNHCPAPCALLRPTNTPSNAIDNAINAIIDTESDNEEAYTDEFGQGREEIGARFEGRLLQKVADCVAQRARLSQAQGKGQQRSVKARNPQRQAQTAGNGGRG